MKLPNGEVDVFIYNFKEEKETEEGGIEYLYEFNHFRTNKITEDEIKADPYKYLEYTNRELTALEKIDQLEAKIEDLEKEIEVLKQ